MISRTKNWTSILSQIGSRTNLQFILMMGLVEAYNNGANVFLGDGTGNFTIVTGLPVTSAASIAVGDYNSDGRPDIATCNYFNPEMSFRKKF